MIKDLCIYKTENLFLSLNMGDSEIREWAQTGENIDIYQLNAIYEGSGDRKTVCFTYIKTFACFGLQTFGIVTLMQLQWKAAGFECSNIDTNTVCNGNFSKEGWIAFFFAMFVSITIGEQIRTLGEYGM